MTLFTDLNELLRALTAGKENSPACDRVFDKIERDTLNHVIAEIAARAEELTAYQTTQLQIAMDLMASTPLTDEDVANSLFAARQANGHLQLPITIAKSHAR